VPPTASARPDSRSYKAGRIATRIRALGLDLQRDFLDLFAASAGNFLDSWFESAPIKAVFGFDSVVGNYASPYTPGSAYVLLHQSFGEVNGRKGVWGHAIGGMGTITQAMAKAATTLGVDIRLSTRVRQVLIKNGHAIGFETDKGETIRAATVAAGINPNFSTSTSSIRPPCPKDSGGGRKTGVASLARFG
jgi:phytoene dehydrogenase-like protein